MARTRRQASGGSSKVGGSPLHLEEANALFEVPMPNRAKSRPHGFMHQRVGESDQPEYGSLSVKAVKRSDRKRKIEVAPFRELQEEGESAGQSRRDKES
jgi:hypothetical protein